MNREVEKIRKEIERRKKEYCNGLDAVTELYDSLLSFIDSLQEEPVSEELEEELTNYFNKFKGLESSNWNWRIDSVNIHSGGLLDFARHFVEWQKQKMMKDAIEREVKEDAGGYPFIEATELYDYENDKPLAKAGDKIKVVFIKDK